VWKMNEEDLVHEHPVDQSTLWSQRRGNADDDDDDEEPIGLAMPTVTPQPRTRNVATQRKCETWVPLMCRLLLQRPGSSNGVKRGYVAKEIVTLINSILSDSFRLTPQSLATIWDATKTPSMKNGTTYEGNCSIRSIAPTPGNAIIRGFIGSCKLARSENEIDELFTYLYENQTTISEALIEKFMLRENHATTGMQASARERHRQKSAREKFKQWYLSKLDAIAEMEESGLNRAQRRPNARENDSTTGGAGGASEENLTGVVRRSDSEIAREKVTADCSEDFLALLSKGLITEAEEASHASVFVLASGQGNAFRNPAREYLIQKGWVLGLREALPDVDEDPLLAASHRRSASSGDGGAGVPNLNIMNHAVRPELEDTEMYFSDDADLFSERNLDDLSEPQGSDQSYGRQSLADVLRDVNPNTMSQAIRDATDVMMHNHRKTR